MNPPGTLQGRDIDGQTASPAPALPRRLVMLLAISTGAAVANLYYIQPLLNLVARNFGVSQGSAGLLVTFGQAGYVAGLALLVPLGDMTERRRLITTVLLGTSAAAAACAAAPSFVLLGAALVAVGALSVVAQIIVPLASALAAGHERGHVVGKVMSGLLIGILTARTLSGLAAEIGGWRLVFALAAVTMAALSLMLRRELPLAPPTDPVRYRAALRSVLELIRSEPVLRQRMTLGALGFASFSALWTSLAFLLGGPPYHYSEGVIGLFGLAGLAGAAAAPLSGRFSDRGHGHLVMSLLLLLVPASWALLALGRSSLPALIGGIILLDLGVQGAHISHQAAIYRLRPQARSRLNTAFMVSVFLGGVTGSLTAASAQAAGGWAATCDLGAATATTALIIWALTWRTTRTSGKNAR